MTTPVPAFSPPDDRLPAWARKGLGYGGLIVLPLLLALVLFATKFQGLRLAVAQDHAQLARHLAAGDGFVTHFVRPLSLVFRADVAHHPDLYNAPLHPLMLACAYAVVHPSDRVTAVADLALWVLSVWLTYTLARRWHGPRVAALAACLYGCNVAAVQAALGALPYPLTAVLFLAALALATPRWNDGDAEGEPLPGWRVALAGAACAAMTLCQYVMLFPTLAVAVYATASRRGKIATLLLFAAGFAAPLLPWLWRVARAAGTPFFSLYAYEVLADTGAYPGESVWRLLTRPPEHPTLFFFSHPVDAVSKWMAGLVHFRDEFGAFLDPVVGFLALWAWLDGAGAPARRRLLHVLLGSLAFAIAGSCWLRAEPGLLLVWAPPVAIAAAAHLAAAVPRLAERWAPRLIPWIERYDRWLQRSPNLEADARHWIRLAIALTVAGLVALPCVYYLLASRPGPPSVLPERMEALARQVPPEATLMTDQPAPVAWYANRPAVWLCQQEKDLDTFEAVCGPLGAVYVTQAITQVLVAERGDWWTWVLAPAGVYRGLVPADPMPRNAVLRLRAKKGS